MALRAQGSRDPRHERRGTRAYAGWIRVRIRIRMRVRMRVRVRVRFRVEVRHERRGPSADAGD